MEDTDQAPFVLQNAPAKSETTGNGFPDRYAIKGTGTDRVLTCLEAPNIQVIVKSSLTVTASAARKARRGPFTWTVLLRPPRFWITKKRFTIWITTKAVCVPLRWLPASRP